MASINAPNETDENRFRYAIGLVRGGIFALITACIVNLLVLMVGLAIADFPPEYVGGPFGPLAVGPVVANSAVAAVGATIVYGVIDRYSARPNRAFVIVAGVVLVLSFVMFLAPDMSGAPPSVFAFLGAMHVIAAITIVAVLVRTLGTEGVIR